MSNKEKDLEIIIKKLKKNKRLCSKEHLYEYMNDELTKFVKKYSTNMSDEDIETILEIAPIDFLLEHIPFKTLLTIFDLVQN